MYRKKGIWGILLLLSLVSCGGSSTSNQGETQTTQTRYFVALDGDDTNPGTKEMPFRSLQKAADTASPGDTVYIRQGIYNERLEVHVSGQKGKIIQFAPFAHESVTLDGSGINLGKWGGLIDLSDQSYITIRGITLKNSSSNGILLENAHSISLLQNSTYNTYSSGIGVWNSQHIVVDGNTIELACNDGSEESLSVSNSSFVQVSHNEVKRNGPGTLGGEGIDIKEGSHDVDVFSNHVHDLNNRIGIYVDAWDKHTYGINVYANRVHDCGETGMAVASEMGGLVEKVNFYNNVVYHNKYGGIEVGGWSADGAIVKSNQVHKINILNNTSFENGEGISIDNPDAQQIVLRNNLCSHNLGKQINLSATPLHEIIADHNIETELEMSVKSFFVDTNQYDFHLKKGSPAINAGTDAVAGIVGVDFDGKPRKLTDVGAYEF